MKHCVVDLYLWASRFFVEPTYGELDIFVTVGGLVYVDQSVSMKVRVRLVWSVSLLLIGGISNNLQ